MARRSARKKTTVTTVTTAPVAVTPTTGARLIAAGVADLALPWWPSEVEVSGLAPSITENEKVGSQPTMYRSSEPRAQIRISFTLRGRTLAESAEPWLAAVQALATGKPVVRLLMGASDRGTWQITEAGYTESDWTASGAPAVAEVSITAKRTDTEVPVGPIAKKSKKSKSKSKKKSTKAKTPKAKTTPKSKTTKDLPSAGGKAKVGD